ASARPNDGSDFITSNVEVVSRIAALLSTAQWELKVSGLPSPRRWRRSAAKRPKSHLRIVLWRAHQHTDTPHTVRLLCAWRKRPHYRRAGQKRDELASLQ